MQLRITGADGENGRVRLLLAQEDGTEHQLDLSVFDVSTLVSMLYEARADALNQTPDRAPEVMLPLVGLSFGEDREYQVLRLHTTPDLYQDFAAKNDTPAAEILRRMADLLAKQSGEDPTPWRDPSSPH